MTTRRSDACEIGAEKRLEGLIAAAARHTPSELRELEAQIREAVAAHRSFTGDASHSLGAREAEFEKWRLIHKYIHATPYRDRKAIPRSEQWRDALKRVRNLREPALIDWVVLQIDVATNLEKGIQDMRPRKMGPTFLVMLEFVANAKRKAMAVLRGAPAGEKEGILTLNNEWHPRTREILKQHGLTETDEDGNPVLSSDPMARN